MFTLDKRLSSLLIGLLLLVFTACIPQPGSIPNTGEDQTREAQSSLANSKWRLVSLSEAGVETPMLEGPTVTLEFDAGGQVVGSGGCNSYGAHYQVQGNLLSFREIIHTQMACQQEGIAQQEEHYFQALQTAGRFELTGDRLTIWYDNEQDELSWVKSNGNAAATAMPGVTTQPTSMPTATRDQSTPTPERINSKPVLSRPH